MSNSSSNLDQLSAQLGDKLILNSPMKDLTSLGIGGPAAGLVVAKTIEDLTSTIELAHKSALDFLVIGRGSNLLVSDAGTDKLIIKNEVSGIQQDGNRLIIKSGTILQDIVDFTIKNGLSGLEKMTGIPGTVGGAIYGNAGAYGQTISDHLVEVTSWDKDKKIVLSKTDCGFAYRDSEFKRSKQIILEATFELIPADSQTLAKEAQEVLTKRLVKYPPNLKCPGSFFKNIIAANLPQSTLDLIPQDKVTYGKISAGYFLETVGARGAKLGQIEVANYHANLFINLGDGTAADFYQLASSLKLKVEEKFGVKLEPEVQLINLSPLPDLNPK